MKGKLVRVLEELFVWTFGLLIFLLTEKRLRRARRVTLAVGTLGLAAWWTGLLLWIMGALVAIFPDRWMGGPLAPEERTILERKLTEYADEGTPTYEHTMRMMKRVHTVARLEDMPEGALAAAVLLHDAAHDIPDLPPAQRMCVHGILGMVMSLDVLRQSDRHKGFAVAVSDAVLRHVGPLGYNWQWQEKRLVTKECEGRFPGPVSTLSKALYDMDNMDRMTVQHVVDWTAERRAQPAHGKRSLSDLVRTGADSAYKELSDRVQTLQGGWAVACGKKLYKHVGTFIKDVDFGRVKDPAQFKQAAQEYLSKHPQPPCLEDDKAAQRALMEEHDAADRPSMESWLKAQDAAR